MATPTKKTAKKATPKKVVKKRSTNPREADHIGARELTLFAENDRGLYDRLIRPVIISEARKVKRGTFDPVKSLISWQRVANEAAKLYGRDFGRRFDVPTRHAAARLLRDGYREEVLFEVTVLEAAKAKAPRKRKANPAEVIKNIFMIIVKKPQAKSPAGYWTGTGWDTEKAKGKRYRDVHKAHAIAQELKDKVTANGWQIGVLSAPMFSALKKNG